VFAAAPLWVLLAGLSAVCLGIYDIAKKSSLEGNAVIPVLWACNAAAVLVLAPFVGLAWLAPETGRALGLHGAALDVSEHALVFVKAIIVSSSWLLTFFALKHLPISIAAPLRASAPLFTLLGAIALFGERPTALQWLGILSILAAYFAFSVLGRAEGIRFERNRHVWLLLAGTLVGAASALYDKHLLASRNLNPWALQVWFSVYALLIQSVIMAVAWWPKRKTGTAFTFRWTILLVAITLLLADQCYFHALGQEGALLSVISVMRRTNVIVSFGVGAIVFREAQRTRKAFALAGILVGLVLLVR
jgi:transporter family protein